MSDAITDFCAENKRRIGLVIGVGYDEDIGKVEKILKSVLDSEHRILKKSEYTIGVLELADTSVSFAVRSWVITADYWSTYFALLRKPKPSPTVAGITIPYAQRDVLFIK